MINWNTSIKKPPVSTTDEFETKRKISDKVLLRVVHHDGRFSGYSFGKYHYDGDYWVIENYLGNFLVTHWTEINDPE